MSVAVIIPSYNRKHLLARALDSVLKQTVLANEIIVIDDGSTDKTAEHITKKYPQVKLIQINNHGVSYARNRGIESIVSEWIALLDSDDEWHPEKLETQLSALAAEPDYKICHCDETWIRNGQYQNQKDIHKKHGGWIFKECLPLCAISPSATIIHRSVFEEVGLFDENLPACEDYDFWLRVTHRFPVLFLPKLLVTKYGGHPDQLSQKHWGMDRFRVRALEKILAEDSLSQSDRIAALDMLIEKLKILTLGAKKRNNQIVFDTYTDKLNRYKKLAANVNHENTCFT